MNNAEQEDTEITEDRTLSEETIGYKKDNFEQTTEQFEFDSLVGQTLDGRFFIERNLLDDIGTDKGGIGLIYLARDLKLLEKKVVVKILQDVSLKNPEIARKFKHEKEALIRLDHPNIVRILDSGMVLDDHPYLVMDYIPGYSLRYILKQKGKLDLAHCAHIIDAVTNALAAAHSKQVIHRDIKPQNIMLTPQDEGFEFVRLIDFGIARVENPKLAPVTEIAQPIGTLFYMAPEQLLGKRLQTPAVDIYALAVVIYQMLTGDFPFKAQDGGEMLEQQKQGVKILPCQLRTDLPKAAEKLLVTALDFEPDNRPQNIRSFGREFSDLLRKGSNKNFENEPPPFKDLPVTELSDYKTVQHPTIGPTLPSVENKDTNFPNIILPKPPAPKSGNRLLFGGIILGLLIISIAAFFLINRIDSIPLPSSENNNSEASLVKTTELNELAYFLNVQKMRDGKPYEQPFKSSGQEIFEKGYKFKMVFQSANPGYIYLFNEDKDNQGNTIFHILYPTPKTNAGSAQIGAKQNIETSNNTFSGKTGTEIVWLIWTSQAKQDLELLKKSAFDKNGTITDSAEVQKLADFLKQNANISLEVSKDSANQQTIVKGNSNQIVRRIELEHR